MTWFARKRREAELHEEFAFHVEAKTRELMESGLDRENAERLARLSLDGIEARKDDCRDARGFPERVLQTARTLRLAGRRLMAAKNFSVVAGATFALGIGACTVVFAICNSILFEPLPYRDPAQLISITQNVRFGGKLEDGLPVSAAHVREWTSQAKTVESVALLSGDRRYFEGAPLNQTNVTPGFFETLGLLPEIGRPFSKGDDNVVILSHSFWRDRFHSDPRAIGKILRLNGGEAPEIIGVLPEHFVFPRGNDLQLRFPLPGRADIWRPLVLDPAGFNPVAEFNYNAIGRMRPGVNVRQAADEMTALSQGLVKGTLDVTVSAFVLPEKLWSDVRRPMILLALAVGAVLAICCLNVANLMLARHLSRWHEYAVRASLGAGRARLAAEMLCEGLVLAILGTGVGLLGAHWVLKALPAWTAIPLPGTAVLRIDWRVAGFAVLLCLLTSVAASVLPALRFSLATPGDAMRLGGGTRIAGGGRGTGRLREVLVASEVALCVTLLVAAGLLIRSFDRLMRVDRGFDTQQVMTVNVQLPVDRYREPAARLAVWKRLYESVEAMPGVLAAGAVNRTPMTSEMNVNGVHPEGAIPRPVFEQPQANFRAATPGYFRAAGIALREGRIYSDAEADRSAAVVSESLARRVWPGGSAIGKRFQRNASGEWWTVTGVVADIRQSSLEAAPSPMVYRGERGTGGLTLVARTPLDAGAFGRGLRQIAARIDSEIMLDSVRPMEELVSVTTARRRSQMIILSLFAGAAVLLAALGIWGVVSYAAGQRRGEFGVRMALGATPAAILGLVLRHGLRPILVGACFGALGAAAVSRAMGSFVFGISAFDWVAYAAAALLLLAVAVIACLIPARRASLVDPSNALRSD